MIKQLPAPFVKSDVNLQQYSWIKLDIKALTNSDTWHLASKTPYAGYASINLWLAAWHQVPAGSLPADQDRIQKIADVDDVNWKKVRSIALRNFIKCSDGRLYHKALCKMVNDVWKSKRANTNRTAAARAAALEKKKEKSLSKPENEGVTTNKPVTVSNRPKPLNSTGADALLQKTDDDISLLQGAKENRIEENRVEERDYRLSRAPARGDGDSDANKITMEFLRLRELHYPHDCNLPAPTMTLDCVAQQWLDDGVPIALAYEVMDRVMLKNVQDGKKKAPTNLKFCGFTIENAYIEYKKSGKLGNGQRADAPAQNRDPEREELLFRAAGVLSKDDFGDASIDVLSNEEISKLIAEKQKNGES